MILTADDFGHSSEINHAIIRAHREGVLTSASLMVGGDAADEAVELARQTPTLAVGLHIVAAGARPVLPPHQLPDLVDASGRLCTSPFRAGMLYAFSKPARIELARELRAQFERFASFGLRLSHVDGHMQMHVHPALLSLLMPLLAEFEAPGIRIPRDEFRLSLLRPPRHAMDRLARVAVMRLLSRQRNRLAPLPIRYTDRVYGVAFSGAMTEAYVADLLTRLTARSAELIFHPTLGAQIEPLGPTPIDLATLLSPLVRQAIETRRLRLTSYPFLDRPVCC